MKVEAIIKKGSYFDSATLMLVSKQILTLPGVVDAALLMGTKNNISLLEEAGMYLDIYEEAKPEDLIIAVKGEERELVLEALSKAITLLTGKDEERSSLNFNRPKSLDSAIKLQPDSNFALISIPGRYAYGITYEALNKGLNVFLFSDQVTLEEEVELKNFALKKGLFLMGPDAGTAIVGGVGIAFSNKVKAGAIGIVSASGTGIQEVSSIISDSGGGISQAIGTGGRDLKKMVGGITTRMGLNYLSKDENTHVIIIISKPPDKEVVSLLLNEIKIISKPVVTCFIGEQNIDSIPNNVYWSKSLEEAALAALLLTRGEKPEIIKDILRERDEEINSMAIKVSKNISKKRKYLRGLYSGGTLAYESLSVLENILGNVFSNTPILPEMKIQGHKGYKNSIIDYGDDEFTIGRLHPIIDYSLRVDRMLREVEDEEVAVLLFDIVLGFGANKDPLKEILPVIEKCKDEIIPVIHVCGTYDDFQNKEKIENSLQELGAYCFRSNREASLFAGMVVKNLNAG